MDKGNDRWTNLKQYAPDFSVWVDGGVGRLIALHTIFFGIILCTSRQIN